MPVKSVGAIVRSPLNRVVALKDSGITRPKDLEGKVVGYSGTRGAFQAHFHIATVAVGVSGLPLTFLVHAHQILLYLLGLVIAYAAGFICTYFFGFNDEMARGSYIISCGNIDTRSC